MFFHCFQIVFCKILCINYLPQKTHENTTNFFRILYIISRRTTVYSNKILFFEGYVNYTWIHFKSDKQTVIARTLLFIEKKINIKNFIRINRKYLVNRKFIMEVGRGFWCLQIERFYPFREARNRHFWLERKLSYRIIRFMNDFLPF